MRALTLFALACGAAPTPPGSTTEPADIDADVDVDADSDADSDADGDADGDVDTGPFDPYTGTSPACAELTAAWRADYQAMLDENRECDVFSDCWMPFPSQSGFPRVLHLAV